MKIKNIKIYALTDGKFVVSYLDPATKKRVQKNFTDEVKAKSYLSSLKAPGDARNELGYLNSASTDTAVRVYLEQVPNSYLSQSGKLIREFLEFFSVHGIARLTEENLRGFFMHLKNEFDFSDRSLLVAKSRLQGFFKFLIQKEIIAVSPLDGIKFNRGAPFKRTPIIFEEKVTRDFILRAKKLSPALFYPIFLLIQETAVKTSDILVLQWKDINLKTNTIEFHRSKELQRRSFVVSSDLIEAIRIIDRANDHVFTNLEGQPLQKHIISRELKRFQRQAGLDTKWGLRDLRASYGANFLKRGGSITDLQKNMGHFSHYNTAEIFGRYAALKSNINDLLAVQESGEVSLS
jgi:integrase